MSAHPETKIAITGIGIVSSLGIGVERFWTALSKNERGIFPLERINPIGLKIRNAGILNHFKAEEWTRNKAVRRMTLGSQYGLIACEQAIQDTGLFPNRAEKRPNVLVIYGTTHPVLSFVEEFHRTLLDYGPQGATPMCFAVGVHNAVPFFICEEFGITGGALTLIGPESTGLDTVVHGCALLQEKKTNVVLAGASTELTYPLLKVLETLEPSTILGEGGAFLILERQEDALRRRAKIYASIVDWQLQGLSPLPSSQDPPTTLANTQHLLGEGFAFTGLVKVIIGALHLYHSQEHQNAFPVRSTKNHACRISLARHSTEATT